MSDGKVVFDIRGDSSHLPVDLDRASNVIAKKTAGWTALANAAVGSITNVMTKAASGAAELIKNGVQYNALIQDYTTSFTTMLGSADAAQKKVEELKSFATKTPFAFTDLADATKTMLAFGVSNEEASVALKHLGDISQGNAQKLSSLSLVYGQVRSAGKLMGQDLLQMINAGFNPLQTIAQKTGASMADLKAIMSGEKTSSDFTDLLAAARKEVDELGASASESAMLLCQIADDGAISADTVAAAMRIATSEGGLFFNAMENQSKTFNGQLSTLKDNLSALGGSMTKALFDSLAVDVMPTVNGWVERLQAAFDESGLSGMGAEIGAIIGEIVMSIDWPTPEEALAAATEWWNTAGGIVAGVCTWTLQLFGMPPATAETVGATVEEWWKKAGDIVSGTCSWLLKFTGFSPWTETDDKLLNEWWAGVYETIKAGINWLLDPPEFPDAAILANDLTGWWTNQVLPKLKLVFGITPKITAGASNYQEDLDNAAGEVGTSVTESTGSELAGALAAQQVYSFGQNSDSFIDFRGIWNSLFSNGNKASDGSVDNGPKASGGIFTGTKRLLSRDGSFSTVSEAGPEAILPLDLLWQRMGMMLDTSIQHSIAMMPLAVSPGIPTSVAAESDRNMDDLPQRVASAIREAMRDVRVDMDGQAVAQIITPHVSEEIAADAAQRRWTS